MYSRKLSIYSMHQALPMKGMILMVQVKEQFNHQHPAPLFRPPRHQDKWPFHISELPPQNPMANFQSPFLLLPHNSAVACIPSFRILASHWMSQPYAMHASLLWYLDLQIARDVNLDSVMGSWPPLLNVTSLSLFFCFLCRKSSIFIKEIYQLRFTGWGGSFLIHYCSIVHKSKLGHITDVTRSISICLDKYRKETKV